MSRSTINFNLLAGRAERPGILRSLTEAADDACHLCGKGEYMDVAGMSREVSECRKCERNICGDCAEVDYDMVGDPGYYRCTQWQCPTDCEVWMATMHLENRAASFQPDAGELQ